MIQGLMQLVNNPDLHEITIRKNSVNPIELKDFAKIRPDVKFDFNEDVD